MDICSVSMHHGTPTLHINGKPVFGAMLKTNKNPQADGVWRDDPWFDDFVAAGFRLFQLDMHACNFDRTYDAATDTFPSERFEPLEAIGRYAARCPDAKFMLRVYTEPRGDESAWIQMYPQECEIMEDRARNRRVVLSDGSEEWRFPYETPSYASDIWLRDACRYVTRLCEELIARGLGNHMLGILLGGGDSCEWVKIGPMEDWAGDYSQPMQRGFSQWLTEKYGTDDALRTAWADELVSLRDDLIPSPQAQSETELYLFRHPVRHRRAIDHFEYLASRVAHDIVTLAGAVKAASGGAWLAGVFYGYLQEMVWSNGFFGQGAPDSDCRHTAAARSGHAGLSRVLASQDVDFLCSPYGYGFRGTGGEGGFMSPYESVRLAGKLWYSEEDIRTHLWGEDSGYGQARNEAELLELLKRQFSNILAHQSAAWWCDWAGPTWGSFDTPATMALFKRLVYLGENSLHAPQRGSAAQVAVVIDETSSFYRSTENNLDIPNWRARGWAIARMGAPADFVLLSDILSGKAREYRMYYLLNVFHLSKKDSAALKAILEKDGKVSLFIYAPGFADDESLDPANIERLTGMRVKMRKRQWSVNILPNNYDDPVMASLPDGVYWGTDMQLGPIFSIDTANTPGTVELAASVSQQGRFEPGFAILRKQHYTYAYSVAPLVPAAVLRELAREAGVHIYTEHEDVIYASHNFVMLHTLRSGTKTVRLKQAARVLDAFTGEEIAPRADEVTFTMKAGETRLLCFEE